MGAVMYLNSDKNLNTQNDGHKSPHLFLFTVIKATFLGLWFTRRFLYMALITYYFLKFFHHR